jgi:hypothetical protein
MSLAFLRLEFLNVSVVTSPKKLSWMAKIVSVSLDSLSIQTISANKFAVMGKYFKLNVTMEMNFLAMDAAQIVLFRATMALFVTKALVQAFVRAKFS